MACMRAMRDSAKWVMLILVVAFVGWLVLDWIQARYGAGGTDPNPVVGVVGGREVRREVRLAEWNSFLDGQLAAARARSPQPLNEEQTRQVREAAWEQMVNEILVQRELDRLEIRVTDAEIRQAFRTSPPPEFFDHPAFQTDGRFDLTKYQQYFSSPTVDENLLLQMEAYYREQLPRIKLERQVAAGIYVTETEAWEWFRDRNETARVRFVSLDPSETVPEAAVEVSDQEIRGYYRSHQEEFSRPATAAAALVSIPTQPSAADTAAARSRADSLRRAILAGEPTFEEVARAASADTATAPEGGSLGRLGRGILIDPLDEVAFSLPVGSISDPVEGPRGIHLLRVDSRQADSVSARHILVPITVSQATEESMFNLIDSLEGRALESDLATAAEGLGLPVRRDVTLSRRSDFVPGAGSLGVAVDWAFDPTTEVGDLSPFFENAMGFHVLELKGRRAEGTYDLEEVREEIRGRLLFQKQQERARGFLEEIRAEMESEGLVPVAESQGWTVHARGPFTRVDFVPGLGQGTEAVGAAFGLAVGQVSGVLEAGDRLAILVVTGRRPADREEFEARKESLIVNLAIQRRQEYVQQWLQELRERADVRDLRDQISRIRVAAR